MLKSTGIVRRIDELGRIVIPMELRRTLSIGEKDPVEIFVNGDQIILRKYQPGCDLCGDAAGQMHPFFGKSLCTKCVDQVGRYSDKIKASLQA